ncbi:hypothetical protein PBOI14_70310 [Pseudomonas sp. Boi14]|nr:hypothetical protein PBOI14_70310 [Pseudomonas sp. Boi14]
MLTVESRVNFNDASFEELLNALHDGVYITDGQGQTLKVNQAYERLTGLNGAELLGRPMQELVKSGVISQSASLRVLQDGRPVSVMQSLSHGKKLLVSATPILAADQSIRYVVSTVRDMTELLRIKRERDELQQLKQLRTSTARLHAGQRDDLLQSPLMADQEVSGRVFAQARQVADCDVKVLLQGETGVGKTLVAQFIHNASARAREPFLALNCGALPENLIEAELFGYARVPSPVPAARASAGCWSWPTTVRCFSTRSAICPWRCRSSCSRSSKRTASFRWVAWSSRKWMCASSVPPITTSSSGWPRASSAPTCITA